MFKTGYRVHRAVSILTGCLLCISSAQAQQNDSSSDTTQVVNNDAPSLIAMDLLVPMPPDQTSIKISNLIGRLLLDQSDLPETDSVLFTPVSSPRNGRIESLDAASGSFTITRDSSAEQPGSNLLTFRYILITGSVESNEASIYILDRSQYRCIQDIGRLEETGVWEGDPVSQDPEVYAEACQELSLFIENIFTEQGIESALSATEDLPPLDELVSPRDLQSRRAFATDNSGTLSQSQATNSSEPIPLVAGGASALGTDGGVDGISAISINPALFLTDINSTEETSKWSRVADLTILFPFNDLAGTVGSTDENSNNTIRYVGARSRINISALSQGDQVYKKVQQAYTAINRTSAITSELIESILTNYPPDHGNTRFSTCVDAFIRAARGHTEPSVLKLICDADFAFPDMGAQLANLNNSLEAAVAEAEKQHFGLNLGVDFGDPTLGAIPNASGTALEANLSVGRQTSEIGRMQGRLGFRFQDLDAYENDTIASIQGGLGYELRKNLGFQQFTLSGGLDFRFNISGKPADIPLYTQLFQTDYAYFRFSLSIPITELYQITVNYGAPIYGELGPTMSINANWRMLLPDLGQALGR